MEAILAEDKKRSGARALAFSLQRKESMHGASKEQGIWERDFRCQSVRVCRPVRMTSEWRRLREQERVESSSEERHEKSREVATPELEGLQVWW